MSAEPFPMRKARDHAVASIIERAEADPEFRALLLANPHEGVKRTLGIDPIPGFKINVIEEKPGEVTIVLPAALEESELSDELLDLASGGTSFSAFILYGPPYPDKKPKR
jgi:hypothetical protein